MPLRSLLDIVKQAGHCQRLSITDIDYALLVHNVQVEITAECTSLKKISAIAACKSRSGFKDV